MIPRRRSEFGRAAQVDEIPHFSFLDASKTLRATEIGAISSGQAEAGIEAIVAGG